jgi:hypothetical protein
MQIIMQIDHYCPLREVDVTMVNPENTVGFVARGRKHVLFS